MIYEFTTAAPSWTFLANSIYMLKELRDRDNSIDNVRSLNSSIILNAAATVEGAITSHFERNFKANPQYRKSVSKNDLVTRSAYEYVFEDLESNGFAKKIKVYEKYNVP